MKACFQIAECNISFANIQQYSETTNFSGTFLHSEGKVSEKQDFLIKYLLVSEIFYYLCFHKPSRKQQQKEAWYKDFGNHSDNQRLEFVGFSKRESKNKPRTD